MNLGGFAGGLASGYQAGEKIKLAKQELSDTKDFRERGLKIQEDEAAAKASERKVEQDFRDGYAKITDQYFNPKPIEDGFDTVANPDGTTAQKPRFKPAPTPDTDPNTKLRYLIDVKAHVLKRNPEKLAEFSKYVQEQADTDTGRNIMGALAGNTAAMVNLGKEQGFDGTKAKITFDPKTDAPMLDTGDGRTIDLSRIADGLSVLQASTAIRQRTTDRRAGETHTSNLNKNDASIKRDTAQTDLLIPAQAAQANESGNLSRARTNEVKAKTAALGNGTAVPIKVAKDIASFIGGDEMAKNNPHERMYGQMLAERIAAAAGKGGKSPSPQLAAAQGLDEYRQKVIKARAAVKANPAILTQRGVKTAEELVQQFINQSSGPTVIGSDSNDGE